MKVDRMQTAAPSPSRFLLFDKTVELETLILARDQSFEVEW